MFLRQRWTDSRLASSNFSDELTLINDYLDDIWVPDLYIANDKVSKVADVTVPNYLLRISRTGDLWYSQRVTSTVNCDMKLHHYPFDVQKCQLQLATCKLYTTHVQYFLRKPNYLKSLKLGLHCTIFAARESGQLLWELSFRLPG